MENDNHRKVSAAGMEPGQDNRVTPKRLRILLAGIFLVSFSLLALEISLTRVLSVVLYYHYVFVVISLALLGLGAGGIYVHVFRRRLPHPEKPFGSLARFASLFALSILLSVMAIARIGAGDIIWYWFFLFIPFFLAGLFLAEVFRLYPALSSRIYGADLLGAAAGSLGAVFILNTLGGINAILLVGVLAAAAALLYAFGTGRFNIKGIILPALSFLLVANLLGVNLTALRPVDIAIGNNPTKEIYNALNTGDVPGDIVETRWSAFGRTDLVTLPDDPGQMGIYIDGTSGTPMYRFNGDINQPDPAVAGLKLDFPGYLPLSFLKDEEKNNALIIGAGGGRDTLLNLMSGVRKITAVEVNQELVDIMREYAWYNGGIYNGRPGVSVYVDEGRNFLKRQKEKYDIIMLSLPVTKTSRSPEGFALTENFLFTVDSIDDYLDHLTDEGRLVVVAHDTVEVVKLLSISLTSFERRGVDAPTALRQIYFIGSHHQPVFVLRKTPFETAEMVSIHKAIHLLGYDPSTSYLPDIRPVSNVSHENEASFTECAMFLPPAVALSRGDIALGDLETLLHEERLDISPVTDNNPFFYKFEHGIPASVTLVLWASIITLLLVIFIPGSRLLKRSSYRRLKPGDKPGLNLHPFRFVVLFLMLGVGFMLVEISAIQRFILFLGQPVLSLAVLLFSLLVGAGLGSLYTARFTPEKLTRMMAIVSALIVAVLTVYAFSFSTIFGRLLGLELALRLLVTVVLLVPLGFLMGCLFPSGMRLLKETGMEEYIPWMWGINGVGSVLGSAATIVVAINFGFTEALLLGATGYFVVFLLTLASPAWTRS